MNKTNNAAAAAARNFRNQVEALNTAASASFQINFQHLCTAALGGQAWAVTRLTAALAKLAGKRRTKALVLAVIKETDTSFPGGALPR